MVFMSGREMALLWECRRRCWGVFGQRIWSSRMQAISLACQKPPMDGGAPGDQ